MFRSVSKRWFINTVGVVFVILAVSITALSFNVANSTYGGIEQTLTGRAEELLNVLSSGSQRYKTSSEFMAIARDYIENFPDKDDMEIMALNRTGKVMITSTGFEPDHSQEMPDYTLALESPDNTGNWVGRLNTGEKVMAITRVVRDSAGSLIGSVRYMVSMEAADMQISRMVMFLTALGVVVMLLLTLSGLFFIRSILTPIKQITQSAGQIAQGNFDVRIERGRDEEIAALCDSINDMAGELQASERMKNDFISSVSHELRTPLTSIKGWAETLQQGVDEQTEEKGMNVIIRESERLSGLVEELLDFSRIQSGRMQLSLSRMDLISELTEAVYLFTQRTEAEGKSLIYKETEDIFPAQGDVNRLRQVFINILDNAIKYTEPGGTITVRAEKGDGCYRVTVEDTGCGIPEEHLPNVKKKFYKANQLIRGSGIGLAVADEIILMHGGSLDIESTVGVGTKVTVTIPDEEHFKL